MMGIKVCFHWGNIAKTLSLVAIAIVLFYMIFSQFETSRTISAIVGIVTGTLITQIGTSIWEPWHFEAKKKE